MAYDPASGRVVLFGGLSTSSTDLADTWTWDGSDWTQEMPLNSPPARDGFGFADGSAISSPVLFGGEDSNIGVAFGDTWTWDSSLATWTPQLAAGPSPREFMQLAFDAAMGKAVLFGGYALSASVHEQCGSPVAVGAVYFNDTWVWDGTSWTQLTPSAAPGVRRQAAMGFDSVNSTIELFGGLTPCEGFSNDTWVWDGTTWSQKDLSAPDELQFAMLAREPLAGTTVLFGGQNEQSGYVAQTWRWDGGAWQLLAPLHSPQPRGGAAMIFDAATDTTLLFGGYDGSAPLGDTWSWDGNDWKQLNPATSPPPRYYATTAYDAATGQIVVFGGFSGQGTGLNDTWTWDGSTWTQHNPPTSPPGRFGANMAYDAATMTMVLFGGIASPTTSEQSLDDTWTWNGSNWTEQQPANVPPPRAYSVMAYDPTSSSVILFGGCNACYGSTTYNDTWSWNGSTWTLLQTGQVPFERTNAAVVDGTEVSPLLMFGGRRTADKLYPSGTDLLNDLWEFGTAQPLIPASVVSRKTHGSAGTFDVDLPLTGNPGIECRSGGANGDYTLLFSFANPLTSVDTASVTNGTGSISSSNIDSNDAHNYIVNLTGVTNAQTITVSLSNVSDSAGNFSSAVSAQMGVLQGDVNASGRVDAADVSLVRQQTLQSVTISNFREDINASGRIDSADVSIARQQTLTSLP
jgi:hypothetical protein